MITLEQLQKDIPAIFSERPAGHVSSNYSFIPTNRIITSMVEKGWEIDSARCPKFRTKDRAEGGKHEITFSHPKFHEANAKLGHVRPVLRLINSHDWSSRFSFLVGMMRKICGNGLYISNGEIDQISLRHNNITDDIHNVIDKFEEKTNIALNNAAKWQQLMLTNDKQVNFANNALNIRFENNADADPYAVLHARRTADEGDDLWSVFNRVQENLMVGGFKNANRKSRSIKNIDKDRSINERLWVLAEDTYTIASATS